MVIPHRDTLAAGTFLSVWLADQPRQSGHGNGFAGLFRSGYPLSGGKDGCGNGLPQIIRLSFVWAVMTVTLRCWNRDTSLRYASDIADGQRRWFYLPALYSVRIARHQKGQEKGVLTFAVLHGEWFTRWVAYGIALLLIALQHVPGYLEPRQSWLLSVVVALSVVWIP